MRAQGLALICVGLAACAPAVPDSGVGFGDYATYQQQRDAELNGTAPRGAPPPFGQPPASGFDPDQLGAAIDRAEGIPTAPPPFEVPDTGPGPATGVIIGEPIPLTGDRPRGNAPSNIRQESGEVAAPGGVSDEQDFGAVSSRETIESDKERLARNAANFQVVQPTALPERSGDTGPNIVQFALRTTNSVGEPVHSRSGVQLNSSQAACSRYASSDQAQEAFLAGGGPERNAKGLDPDGDGFACDWDPRPYRAALN